MGITPGARAANLPCVGHTRRPIPPTELPPANPPLSEPCHLQKSHSPACWNEPAPAWATHGGKPPDHGAAMHGPPSFDVEPRTTQQSEGGTMSR